MKNKIFCSFVLLMFFSLLVGARGKTQIWVIDAGHGGHDVGCEGTKAKEKDINLAVSKRVAELVRTNISGVKVVMTRDTDRFLTLDQRAQTANNLGANLFLSIHVNFAPEASGVRGTETFYGPLNATSNSSLESARKKNIQKSELLAWEMQKQYGLAGRPISRGVKRERYYVILYTKMPAVLTEIGFISNAGDQAYMTSKAGQEEIAQCIYKGLVEYKQTVEAGKEKSVVAEMRRTRGKSKDNVVVDEATLLAANDTSAEEVEASKETQETSPKTTGKRRNGKDVASNNADKKSASSNDKSASSKTSEKSDGQASNKRNGKSSSKTDVKDSKQQTESTDAIPDPSLEPELEDGALNFYVQIFALTKKIAVGDKRMKGLKDIKIMEKDGKYKYLAGNTSDHEQARKNLAEIRKVFPDAFLVAFLGSRQISTADAMEMVVK